ncbi:MAG: DUF4160 domain-containing protein [Thermoguttaceae bacterium]
MATVRAFRIDGLKLWFWSDDHEPPHFHAKKSGEWEVKIHFLLRPDEMIEVKWAEKRPSASFLKQLRTLASEQRTALLEEWERLRGV